MALWWIGGLRCREIHDDSDQDSQNGLGDWRFQRESQV
jgi:hypothetical protein